MAEKGAVHSIIDDIHERARLIQKRVIEAANEMIPRIKTDIFTEFDNVTKESVVVYSVMQNWHLNQLKTKLYSLINN